MFYELIYTRCRQGLDITKKGQKIASDGFKVYSCAPEVMEEGKVDLQFLANAAQAKQSYIDPDFMDDAYLYYTPDTGDSFLVNFFPVSYDKNAAGDYSHRPGNFLNHVLIGNFSNFYPYEIFNDSSIWTAKAKGEAFYYETPPDAAGFSRRDISDPPGQYSFDEIGAFIKDGREEALKKTVSFLISQQNEDHKKRKFLVIKEESSKNIELWIAAIECAFSPKIASKIPFATRMDKFTTVNKYTSKNGLYQIQINLQDPSHIHKYRAMIVGVNEQDKANLSLARPLANSSFAVLDGRQKKAEFEADISNPYYQFIARFDDQHRDFCRRFLQSFEIFEPCTGIFDLYEADSVLTESNLPCARKVSVILDNLSKYKTSNSNVLKSIYSTINKNLSGFLQEDLSSGLKIINWLQNTSKITGDNNARENLSGSVCELIVNLIYNKFDNAVKKSNWEIIKGSDFYADASAAVTNAEIINKYLQNIKSFDQSDVISVLNIYLDAAAKTGNINLKVIDYLAVTGVSASARINDAASFKEIILIVSKCGNKNEKECLYLFLNKDNISDEARKFIANYIIESENLKKPADIESFIKQLQNIPLTEIKENVLAFLFDSLSAKCGSKALLECLLRYKFTDEEQTAAINALQNTAEVKLYDFVKELVLSAKKYKEKWNLFIKAISENKKQNSQDIIAIIIQSFIDTKQNEKSMEKLCDLLENENAQKYFDEIAEKTMEKIKGK